MTRRAPIRPARTPCWASSCGSTRTHPSWHQRQANRARGDTQKAYLIWKIAREPKSSWLGRFTRPNFSIKVRRLLDAAKAQAAVTLFTVLRAEAISCGPPFPAAECDRLPGGRRLRLGASGAHGRTATGNRDREGARLHAERHPLRLDARQHPARPRDLPPLRAASRSSSTPRRTSGGRSSTAGSPSGATPVSAAWGRRRPRAPRTRRSTPTSGSTGRGSRSRVRAGRSLGIRRGRCPTRATRRPGSAHRRAPALDISSTIR